MTSRKSRGAPICLDRALRLEAKLPQPVHAQGNRELDPALPVFWQLHRGRSHRRNCANANGHPHRDLRIVPILHWADQFPTRDTEVLCGARSVPGREEGMMEILLVVWFGRFRGLAGE
jgi:hypothetical protein